MGWSYTEIAEDLGGEGQRKGNISHKLGCTSVFKACGFRGTWLPRRVGRASFLFLQLWVTIHTALPQMRVRVEESMSLGKKRFKQKIRLRWMLMSCG